MTRISETAAVAVETSQGVAHVTLDRPAVLNAVDRRMRVELARVLRGLAEDEAVAVIVIRGAGRAFCAGQDQAESAAMTAAEAAQRITDYADLYRALRQPLKPVLAQVHGYAIGAGLQMALLCDMIFMARSAQIAMPELLRGSAAITGSGLLWPIVGAAVTKQLVLNAGRVGAERALSLGLVQEVVEDDELDAAVARHARELAQRPPMGTRVTKEWWNRMSEELFEATLAQAAEAHARNFATGALTQGARDFMARKRTA